MAAGKRNGECCACHLLRWEPAAASPGGSALPPAPAPAAPEAPRPSGAPVLGCSLCTPRGNSFPSKGRCGAVSKEERVWGCVWVPVQLAAWLSSPSPSGHTGAVGVLGCWRAAASWGGSGWLLGDLPSVWPKGCKHPQNVCAPCAGWEVASGCAHGGFAARSPESWLPRETAGL